MHTKPYAHLTNLIGKRVRLQYTNDMYTRLRPGDEGVVDFIDDFGTVHVSWENGSSMGLITSEGDRFTVIQEEK